MDLVWSQEYGCYERSTIVYTSSRNDNVILYGGSDSMICCGVEREEIYMGGGVTMLKCHTCGSKMETNI
tara:strand:+ start:77 stop:283 length:207 start_codon:yes stop_codon:yes gene_type:complete